MEVCALQSAFLVLVLGVDGLLLWTSGLIPNMFALFKYCYFAIFCLSVSINFILFGNSSVCGQE